MDFIANLLPYFFYVILAIMILVFVHEMGHFLFAKLFGMRVERFSVGFPPKLIGKWIGETEYVIGATPLGGYVKIVGMVDESMDTDALSSEPQPWEFRAKPVWQRIVVITAGVIFNMILAFIIFSVLKGIYGDRYIPAENVQGVYVSENTPAYDIGLRTGDRIVTVGGQRPERYDDLTARFMLADDLTVTVERGGQPFTFDIPEDMITRLNRSEGLLGISPAPSLIGGVQPDSPAAAAGLQAGDRIVQIGAQPVSFWGEMLDAVQATGGGATTVRFVRADTLAITTPAPVLREVGREPLARVYETTLTPYRDTADSLLKIGVQGPTNAEIGRYLGERRQAYGIGEAIGAGAVQTVETTGTIITSLVRVFSGRDNLRENLGGPVAVARVTREAAERGWDGFWIIVAMLSITLAIMNILPIPALDGGHLMFLIYEGIVRREPSLRFRMIAQQIGMAVLLLFMVFLIFNDTIRLFG